MRQLGKKEAIEGQREGEKKQEMGGMSISRLSNGTNERKRGENERECVPLCKKGRVIEQVHRKRIEGEQRGRRKRRRRRE